MKPDRSNYEIWFTDWLDGNLGEEQVEEFKIFLKENPDLQEELIGLNVINLEPSDFVFSGKNNLKKSPESLSEAQFEHLCIANLENDLTPSQKAELNKIIDNNENRRRSFELIQKLKLKPSAGSFKRKSSVKKLTAGQKIFRLSVIGLSAAATIALLVAIYLFSPANMKKETPQTAQNIKPDTLSIESHPAIIIKEVKPGSDRNTFTPAVSKSKAITSDRESNVTLAEQINQQIPDSISVIQRSEALSMLEVKMPENIIMAYRPTSDVLLAYSPGYIPPLIDERSNVERFLARLFHEKIMRDPVSGNRPVESFEIAAAGISGLNKLFGWEMALHKNTDENGEIRSYNFTSKLLKFNAPVKKTSNPL
jgi:hypothetical protein